MTLDVNISDGSGSGRHKARVTHNGELIVRDAAKFSTAIRTILDGTGTAFNITPPKAGSNYIVTGLLVNADKSVTATAVVEIYESSSATSTIQDKGVITIDVTKNTTIPLFPLRLIVSEGAFLNAETDDATVNITTLGYFTSVDHLGEEK